MELIHRNLSTFVLVLGALQAQNTSAFLDIGESLKGAGAAIKESLVFATDMYHQVRRVTDFANSVIDEDCVYECSYNRIAVPNPDHVKSSNGCGSLNLIFDHTDNSPVRLDEKFIDCCNQHDFCYDTCQADKDQCDLDLKKCMYKVCKDKQRDFLDEKKCKATAKTAYLLVMAVGCQLYKDSQDEACQCVKKTSRKNELW